MKTAKEWLKEFSSIPGLTGMEKKVAQHFIEQAKPFSDQVFIDKMGNGIAVKKGQGKRSILAAGHIDEIGMMVTKIEEGGYLKMTQVGGVDPTILPSQEVTIHTSSGQVSGVIGSKPPHFLPPEERNNPASWETLFIDTGLSDKQVKAKIKVGDFVSFNFEFRELMSDNVSCKSIDDRYGVVVLLMTLQRLSKMKPEWDFYAVGTVQEEWSGIGANSAAYNLNPDVAVAIDVTHGDIPGLKDSDTFKLGKGITLSIGPNIHSGILKKARNVCKQEEIPYEIEVAPWGTGTDAYTIQIVKSGIPCIVISAPVRSMHSPVETISTQDIDRSARLLANLICSLEDEDLNIDQPEEEEEE